MKNIYSSIIAGLWVLLLLTISNIGTAQTCDVTPMNISKLATDWTTNCARTTNPDDQCDPTNGPICDGTPGSNWLLLNPNNYCIPKPPCNAIGFSKIEVTMTMEGTYSVKNIGNLTQNTSVGLLGCIKAWIDDQLFDPLTPSAFTGTISLAAGQEKSGNLPTRTATSAFPGDYAALFTKACSGNLCFEGLADGFTTLTISNGNLQAVTTVLASLKACVNYNKFAYTVTGTEDACETSANGKIFVNFTPAPGTIASDYEIRVGNGSTWSVSQTAISGDNTLSGLLAGNYTLAIVYKPLSASVLPSSDATCGYCKESVTINSSAITLTCSSDPDCPDDGIADGSVTVNVSGNNLGTVTYNWGGGNTAASLNDLAPGDYTVTVNYGPNGKCSKMQTCTVSAAPGVIADVSSTNVVCNGGNNGTITVDPTSGKANFTIAVTGKTSQTSDGTAKTFTNLAPGTYDITVTDANGCSKGYQVKITEPNPVSLVCASENTSCKGLSDGKVKVTSVTSDAGGPYKVSISQIVGDSYSLAEATQAIPFETSVGQGTYVITVKDKNGCIARCTTLVKDGFIPTINCSVTQIACFGGKGAISATASATDADGNPVLATYQYTLSGSASASNTTGIFSNLGAGTYSISAAAIGKTGCSVSCTNNVIVEPAQLSCNISGNNSVCPNAKITFSGPAAMTNYLWSVTGATFTGQNTSSIEVTAPASGSFEVKLITKKTSSVDNLTLCESGECTKTVTVTVPTCPVIAAKTVCAGTQNVEFDAGTGYTNIVWSTSDPKISIASGQNSRKVKLNVAVSALGGYTVTFSALQNGCPLSCDYGLTVDPLPTLTLTPEQPICRNPPSGKITVSADGGTQPYKFIISKDNVVITPSTTNVTATGLTFIGLAEGNYSVVVIDKNGIGCSSDPKTQVLAVSNPLNFDLTLVCSNQDNNGNVAVNVTNITGGANAPNGYEYQVDGTSGVWYALVNPIYIPVNTGDHSVYLREKGVATGCDPFSKTINTTCCELKGVCKLTTPSPITACTLNAVPAAKTNPSDVFSGITYCKEARIKVTTADGGSLCGTGLTRTYTYLLYDDVIDNDVYDNGEPFISGTCSETYTVTPPVLSCSAPADKSITETCTTQDLVTLFTNWKNAFTYSGGCSPSIRYLVSINDAPDVQYQSLSSLTGPTVCGGKMKVTILVKDDCTTEKSCSATFMVATRPDVSTTAPQSVTKDQCDLATDFSSWKNQFSASGGCSPVIKYYVSIDGGSETQMSSISSVVAPGKCGGSVKIRIVITDDCNQSSEKQATYTITKRSDVTVSAPQSVTKDQCDLATDFSSWKNQFSASGGCSPVIKYYVSIDGGEETQMSSISSVVAPGKCGGSVKIRIVITDDCNQSSEKQATYTITKRSDVTVSAPQSVTKDQCDLATDFSSWKNQFSASGGCSPVIKYYVSIDGGSETQMSSISSVVAPGKCGGSVKIRIVITDDCNQSSEKQATYTITKRSDVTVSAPQSVTKDQCDLATDFSSWKNQFSASGGCSPVIKYYVSIDGGEETQMSSISSVVAPGKCGGSVKIRIVITDDCNQSSEKQATYTITKRSDVTVSAPQSVTKDQCDLATDFSSWKNQFSASGGCSPVIKYYVSIDGGSETQMSSISSVVAPGKCGGSVKIRIVITDDCNQSSEKQATYTITKRSDVTVSAPQSVTKDQCDLATDFSSWKNQFSASGGCSPVIKYYVSIDGGSETQMSSISSVVAPGKCGGSVKIRIVITDDCNQSSEKQATYTITKRSDVTVSAPQSVTKDQCDLATDFSSWKNQFSASGGCSPVIKYYVSIDGGSETQMSSISSVVAPGKCGGSVKIRIVITDDCNQSSEKQATYTITKRSDVTVSAPQSVTKDQCDLATDFSSWKNQFSASGGCSPVIKYYVSIDGGSETQMSSISSVVAPGKCGGSVKIRIVITDDCNQSSEKQATYTITKRSDVTVSAPQSVTKDQCDLATDFSSWKNQFSASGGCSPVIKYYVSIDGGSETQMSSISSVVSPGKCGGSVKIRIVITDDCNQSSEKQATYTITKRSDVTVSAPQSVTKDQCDLASDFNTWKNQFSASGGCSPVIKYYVSIDGGSETQMSSISSVVAPGKCGGSVKIRIVITDDCNQSSEKQATYTITKRSDVTVSAPQSVTKDQCDLATDFSSWKNQFSASGGCSPVIKYYVSIDGGEETQMSSISSVVAPGKCGGSVKIRIVITDDCNQSSEKQATYTITKRSDVAINSPGDKEVRCLLQSAINSEFASWIAQFSTSGGCSATVKYFIDGEEVKSLASVSAPSACGGSVTVKITITDLCDQSLTKTATFTAIPKPVGNDLKETIYSCLPVKVNLPEQLTCNISSTYIWYSVASIGSSTPFNNTNVEGETISLSGTGSIITDVLTNLSTVNQTIIYRVVPTSDKNCVGEPFYITVTVLPKPKIECLACISQVNVTLDANCTFALTPKSVLEGFATCPNRELLESALEVIIGDGNTNNLIDCAGTYKYVIQLKKGYEKCFDYTPCWGTVVAEDKTAPSFTTNYRSTPLLCSDINTVLNNAKTIGAPGTVVSPGFTASTDDVKNIGQVIFTDNCATCGCVVSRKWSDKVVYYGCDSINSKRIPNLFATIFRTWSGVDCFGNTSVTVQEINFVRPSLADFKFLDDAETDLSDGKPYDAITVYNSCKADESLIKTNDYIPYISSYFGNKVYLDKQECNFSVGTLVDERFPICNGTGVKIDRKIPIFDWCAGKIVDTLHVLIKIGDFEAPTLALPAKLPIILSTGPMDCTASFLGNSVAGLKNAFGITVSDNCDKVSVATRVRTLGKIVYGIVVDQTTWFDVDYKVVNGYTSGLPVGRHKLIISAYDGCYNTLTDSVDFYVLDRIAPVMKCNDKIIVTLSNANGYTRGYARVDAKDIDEGSSDNCNLDWIRVRRSVPANCYQSFIDKGYDTNGNGKLDTLDGFDNNGNGKLEPALLETFRNKNGTLMTPVQSFVEFFCCDAGNSVRTELWGRDGELIVGTYNDAKIVSGGNLNFCWQDIVIEDKVAPVCMAPLDVTIDCLDKNLQYLLGDAKNKSIIAAAAKIFGDVTIMSGSDCANLDTTYTVTTDLKCGYGTVKRSWTLTKTTSKGPLSTTCSQTIYVRPVHEYNICFPKDAVVNCRTKFTADTVKVDELACDILAVNVSDKRYVASDDECYKIFRTYTVINWCTYDDRCGDPMSPENVYTVDRKWGEFGKYATYVLVRQWEEIAERRRGYGHNQFFLSRDTVVDNWNASEYRKLSNQLLEDKDDERIFPESDCKGWGNEHAYRDRDDREHRNFIHSWMYTQIIKVYDTERPVVKLPKLPTCPVSSAIPGAASINFPIDPASCVGPVSIAFKGTDNCSTALELEPSLIRVESADGSTKLPSDYDKTWSTARLASDSFKVSIKGFASGSYNLIVVLRDECGNLSVATRIPFTVGDCKAPVPICINGLSTDLMPVKGGGAMTVWAKDFIASPAYDCNGQGNSTDPKDGPNTKDGLKLITKYSVNRLGKPVSKDSTSITVTCADAGKQIPVEVHAWDEKGNHDFCVTYLLVNDNNKVCPANPGSLGDGEIAGLIQTEAKQSVQGVTTELSGKMVMNMNTASDGKYEFKGLEKGYDYSVTPILDANPLNGVSTFDLVLMQKHILGIQPLDSPYKMIAADINNSKSITTLDLILLRKLILNLDTKFTANTSWRFVDAAYRFPNPSNPWSEGFPEISSINNLTSKVNADFVAVKIGDVNGNASPTSAAAAQPRKAGKLELSTEEQRIEVGQEYQVDIRAKDLKTIEGYQFTLELDRNKVDLVDIDYGVAKAENFGIFQREGVITTSWNRKGASENDDAILFTLHLQGKGAAKLSEALTISSRYTANEAYQEGGDYLSVAMSYTKAVVISDQPELLQNTPNPFADQTQIGFYLPQATEGRLTIRDAKGSIVYRLKADYNKGWNQVTIKQGDLKAAGVLYYTLETPDFTATKKMVVVNR